MQFRHPRARLAALPLALLAIAAHSRLHAQSTQALPETVVSASRFAEPLAALPLGVSVLQADEIRASGATTVNEAIARLLGVPGRQDAYGAGDLTLDLRGFGETAGSNQVVVLDGVRLNEADMGGPRLAGISIDAVERIEVLRGNGAVLYGEGATGGVIVITTKAGLGKERRNSASVHAVVGSHDRRELRASATLASGGFSLDVHGQRRETDNHRANFRSESDGADITAQWSNDWLRLGARHGRDALDARLPGPLSTAEYAADPTQVSPIYANDFGGLRNERSGVFAEAMLGEWQLALDHGWRDKFVDSTQTGWRFGYDVESVQTGLRARREGRLGGLDNAFVIGHDVGHWERASFSGAPSAPRTLATQRTRAWYAKNDLTLASGTRLSVGARTETLNKSANNGADRLRDRVSAWELGASHPFAGIGTLWARAGTSFRLANVDEFSFTNPAVAIRPQSSRDVEAGWRGRRGDWRWEARLYRSELTDEIGYDPNAVGPGSPFFNGANINFDPTRRQGVELDGDWAVTPALRLGVRVALRRSSFRAGPYAGRDVPLAPRQALALRADWAVAAGHRLGAGLNWVGAQHPDFANQCRMPATTTVDLRYAWQVGRAELSLGVSNLFDRQHYTLAYACAGNQPTAIYPEAGRTVSAALRVAF